MFKVDFVSLWPLLILRALDFGAALKADLSFLLADI